MREIKSSYFVLKTEFTTTDDLEFGGFIDYITRDDVKQSPRLEKAKEKYEFKDSKLNIKQEQYLKYLDYMGRKAALEKKEKYTADELKSLEYLKKHEGDEFAKLLEGMKQSTYQTDLKKELTTGAFDFFEDDLSEKAIKAYKKKFNEAQKNNSVMYKDIISFSTEALIIAGIFNPYTNELNRKPLIEASRKMMREMYKREKLDLTGFTVGEIHYNTNHFHLHFATVESTNTRRMIEFEGKQQARGLRKESTLQAMKSVFANHIFDRTEKLVEISKYRDQLRKSVKDELHGTLNERALFLLSTLKKTLPTDKRKYNSKNLSESAKKIMEELIDELMRSKSEFNHYKRLAIEEDEHREKMYGKLSADQSSFFEGRMRGADGIYYRLGNSILEELRKNNDIKESSRAVFFKRNQIPVYGLRNVDNLLNESRYQLKRFEYMVDNRFELYKIQQEHLQVERDIQRARWEQSL